MVRWGVFNIAWASGECRCIRSMKQWLTYLVFRHNGHGIRWDLREVILDTCGKIKMGNLEESSSVSHAWGLGCEDRGYLSIAVWRVAGLGGRRTRQVVWCGALQPFRLITPAPDALQAPLLQELQIMHDTRLISHIRHIQTFNYIHRKLFGEHIFCPLTSRTLWFKSSKACFELHKIIFEAITVNLNV